MPHVYGLRPDQVEFQKRAATLASEVLTEHAADVDANARFPKQGVATLARVRSGGRGGQCFVWVYLR
jgi:hypothetical protein